MYEFLFLTYQDNKLLLEYNLDSEYCKVSFSSPEELLEFDNLHLITNPEDIAIAAENLVT
jgi:hypothetical protein